MLYVASLYIALGIFVFGLVYNQAFEVQERQYVCLRLLNDISTEILIS